MGINIPKLRRWLALTHAAGITSAQINNYLTYDPHLTYLPKGLNINWSGVKRDLDWLASTPGAHILTLDDAQYPTALKNIFEPPPVLYTLGNVSCLQRNQIAIVGSRTCTQSGLQQATKFARGLSTLGLVITSGLSQGIDAAAHKAALVKGQTIACLAHGLDLTFTGQHAQLAQQITRHGCLVSEFCVGTIPLASHYARRNRIISGLCLGVLVVEAGLASGSLVTARYAIDQGREVFAIPGSIDKQQTRGCHWLLKQGAKLVECLPDIIEELEALLNFDIRDKYAGYIKTCPHRANA